MSTMLPATRWRQTLLADGWSALATLIIAVVVLAAVPRLLSWAVIDSVWAGDAAACRDGGACWAFLRAKLPFILFGIYPEMERWRPVIVVVAALGLALWSMPRSHWTLATLLAWIALLIMAPMMLGGGFLGLSPIPTAAWGGLPITILLTAYSLALGLPLGIVLALARRSPLPVLRWSTVMLIEIIRGLPIITLLFIAILMLPLLLPDGFASDNLLRAAAVFVLVSAVLFAEVIRGGLNAVGPGQEEAAYALGLGRLKTLRAVVLPQAIAAVLPPLTNTVIVIVKNTSLVVVIGLFDLVSAGRVALADPNWSQPFVETYLFVGLVYFVICFTLSRYARHLEQGNRWGWR